MAPNGFAIAHFGGEQLESKLLGCRFVVLWYECVSLQMHLNQCSFEKRFDDAKNLVLVEHWSDSASARHPRIPFSHTANF
ncbi:hypothetical protein WK32_31575 [Burkholderia vietnamiensis]|nr:hypothetical protein WK32_31575 [Burkholderia vietnamiensis]